MKYEFPITDAMACQVLHAALAHGGDYSDLFFEHTQSFSLVLQDGQVSQASQAMLHGMGVRTVAGDKTGYSYTMDLSMPQMLRAANAASCICMYGNATECEILSTMNSLQLSASCYDLSPVELSLDQRKNLLLSVDKMIRSLDDRVVAVRAMLNSSEQNILFYNSLGETYQDVHPRTTIALRVVLQDDAGHTEAGSVSQSRSADASTLDEDAVMALAREAVRRASVLFEAEKPQGGEMPVVLAAGASGIFMHEALGHAFEADFVRKGTSIFADRMGEQVCMKGINIVDDGTLHGDTGSINWDDEGVPSQCTMLVEDGRLTSFLHDRISAKHFHVAPTGNGRRESFRKAPLPRMRSTYMLAGTHVEEELIANVKHGIYAELFTNGQVQIGAGDFTFYMKLGRMIENGRLTHPIRDVNIIGNGPQALADITMVANNLQIDSSAGMCGKGGQQVPVSNGLPSVLVKNLTVGGD